MDIAASNVKFCNTFQCRCRFRIEVVFWVVRSRRSMLGTNVSQWFHRNNAASMSFRNVDNHPEDYRVAT